MRLIGSRWKEHRLAAVLLVVYWSIAFGLEVSGWHTSHRAGAIWSQPSSTSAWCCRDGRSSSRLVAEGRRVA